MNAAEPPALLPARIIGPSALGGSWKRFLYLSLTLALTDFKLRFFGSVLGYFWQLMRPLLLFGVLYFVFTEFVKVGSAVPFYPVVLLSNILLFTFFQEGTGAVSSVSDREGLVRKIQFPRLAIPVSCVLMAALNLALNSVVILTFALASGVRPRWSWLEIPLLLGLLVILILGLAMFLSAAYVRYRDVRPIWEVVMQLLFYASPVIYALETIHVSERLREVLAMNPLAMILQQFFAARHRSERADSRDNGRGKRKASRPARDHRGVLCSRILVLQPRGSPDCRGALKSPRRMRVSVVIATTNRAKSLRVTLDALRDQSHEDFEVVVVLRPSEDETPDLLAERAGQIRVVENPERNLCKSRNLGIDLAAGEVVAFIDDDSVPEPGWLHELAAAYDETIGGAGGLVYDQTGVNLQYRYATCDRVGRTDFGRLPPFDELNRPGADPFVYLQGTNMSFRRAALEAVGGFDENIEYVWDESDLALHLIDAGWKLRPLHGAAVHHKMLPSHLRRGKEVVVDPFLQIKNRSYFAMRNGVGRRSMTEIFRSLVEYLDRRRQWAIDSERWGRLSAQETQTFLARLNDGFEVGVSQGLGPRAGRQLAASKPRDFLPYPVVRSGGQRLTVGIVSPGHARASCEPASHPRNGPA